MDRSASAFSSLDYGKSKAWPNYGTLGQYTTPPYQRIQCWNFRTICSGYRNRVGKGLSNRPASAGTFEQFKGARNRVGIGLSHRPARLQRLAESIP